MLRNTSFKLNWNNLFFSLNNLFSDQSFSYLHFFWHHYRNISELKKFLMFLRYTVKISMKMFFGPEPTSKK